MLAYYWVLATPVWGLLFGCYLYVAVNIFHVHYDEAFSALRIPDFKGFSRLHISPSGDLHVYSLAMDKVGSRVLCHLGCEVFDLWIGGLRHSFFFSLFFSFNFLRVLRRGVGSHVWGSVREDGGKEDGVRRKGGGGRERGEDWR